MEIKKEKRDYDGIVIDEEEEQFLQMEKNVELSLREYELLKYLLDNENVALSRDKILNNVWNYDYYGDSRTIDSHIKMTKFNIGVGDNRTKDNIVIKKLLIVKTKITYILLSSTLDNGYLLYIIRPIMSQFRKVFKNI